MIKKRLRTLAKFLLTVPEGNFKLDTWRNADGDSNVTDEKLNSHPCGTTACAVGWACSIPEFKKLGLSMSYTSDRAWTSCPVFAGKENWKAVNKFFGLAREESEYLFQADSYYWEIGIPLPSDVATRIKNFVERGDIHEYSQMPSD